MNLPESVVAGTHYAQDRYLRSLSLFRDLNAEDETVLNYFDEIEIHPQVIGMVACIFNFLISPSFYQASTIEHLCFILFGYSCYKHLL